MIKKVCKYEGCESTKIWSKGFCKFHTPQKPLKKSFKPINKISEKGKIKKEEKKEYTLKQFDLFKEIYIEHLTKTCFECNRKVDGASSINFHHALYKSKYPKFALEKWNILLVCYECHEKTHTNLEKTPKIKEYTEKLKEKYL